jgi:hypothetical protein
VLKKMTFALSLLMLVPVYEAGAASKIIHHPTITMKAGNRAGLQDVFAWDANCQSVPMRVEAYRPKLGLVYLYESNFTINANQSRECAGRTVHGYKIVFKANNNARGSTLVRYQVRSANVDETFKFRRTLKIK